MNENRSTKRSGPAKAPLAIVLCLMLVVSLLPTAAFAALASKAVTHGVVDISYLNSAAISLHRQNAVHTYMSLDGGAAVEGTRCSTGVYGSHVLKYWSVDASGVAEATITAPFFIDEDIAPVIDVSAASTYVNSASIACTATDNMNGSGIDFLCYRVDGGNFVTVSSPAAAAAAAHLFAGLRATYESIGAPCVRAGCHATDPNGGGGGDGDGGGGGGIDDGTSTPATTLTKTIPVTGLGEHKVEIWAQDVARNVSVKTTKVFTITKAPTTLSINRSRSSVARYKYVTISGVLGGGVPVGAPITVKVKRPGYKTYRFATTKYTVVGGVWSYRVKLTRHGRYYFTASYAGSDTFDAAVCAPSYVSVYSK